MSRQVPMKAIRLSRFGSPDVLEVIEVPAPSPGPGEVLVRMQTAGINFFEVLMRQDRYAVTPELPMTFGVEVAGIVEALGRDVRTTRIGTRVAVPLFLLGRAGGYAEYVAVDADSVVPLPEELSFEDATALMVQGLTAFHLVRRTAPAGKTILVTAAAGGVGSLLVQMVRQGDASRVIAAAGSEAKRELARALGADIVVDYTAPDWIDSVRDATGGAGVDVAYDFIGGAFTAACLAALAPQGELVFGALGRCALGPSALEEMFAKNQSLKGFALLPLLASSDARADLTRLFAGAAQGDLKVVQGGRFPLGQVAEAHRALETRRTVGKVVLVP